MSALSGPPVVEALRKRLAGRTPPVVVAAVGPDGFLRDAVVSAVCEAVLGSPDSPDLVTVRADDPTGTGAAEALVRFFDESRTGTLFGAAKVVALRGAQIAAQADKKTFLAWLANPPAISVSVLLADELPKDVLAALDALDARAARVECGASRGSQRPEEFAAARAAGRGKRLSREDAELLVRCVGEDSGTIDNAVESLSLYAGDEPGISNAAIRALFEAGGDGTQYQFGDRLAEGDAAAALRIAEHCFEEGLPDGRRVARDERTVAIRLVSAAQQSVVRVRAVRIQLDAGVPRQGVRLPEGVPPFLKDGLLRIATQRRREALDALLLAVEETDRGMKSGGAQGRVAVSRLAVRAGLVR